MSLHFPVADKRQKIVSLPNLRIIDYAYGFTGSTHDATAWKKTRMAQERQFLLEPGEWIWADSAYPVCTYLLSFFVLTQMHRLKTGLLRLTRNQTQMNQPTNGLITTFPCFESVLSMRSAFSKDVSHLLRTSA
jgi:hypothetical protein